MGEKKFGKNCRLCYSKEFQFLFRKGYRFRTGHFVVLTALNQSHQARLGVIIPKKALKLSTQRHRLKRIVRESFRLHQDNLKGCDIIIMMKTREYSSTLARPTLEQIWAKINRRHCA